MKSDKPNLRAASWAAIEESVKIVKASELKSRDNPYSRRELRLVIVQKLIAGGFVGSRSAGYRAVQKSIEVGRLRVESEIFACLRLPRPAERAANSH